MPRRWSNRELRRLGPLFRGRVINVSGWQDSDKEGGHYRSYFPHADEYRISNYRGGDRGFQGMEGEIELDLSAPVPEDLRGQFDVVFNHTTLEHVFDVQTAVRGLCDLSSDVVITVVPVAQAQHDSQTWGDYWRFTPTAVRALFSLHALSVVYESVNRHRNAGIYLVTVASRRPDRWHESMPDWSPVSDSADHLGRAVLPFLIGGVGSVARRLGITP